MEKEIINYLTAIVEADDRVAEFEASLTKEARSAGRRLVTHQYECNPEFHFHLVKDYETRETLAFSNSTGGECEVEWDDSWFDVDFARYDAYDTVPWPDVPESLEWFVRDDIDPDDARKFLKEHKGEK